ncbi:hypothetical protein BC629DRAFT_418136 [Irpex lacteus]|nr:hypothetical protein BC629DRAFT_418136 [Irpex lacteus]
MISRWWYTYLAEGQELYASGSLRTFEAMGLKIQDDSPLVAPHVPQYMSAEPCDDYPDSSYALLSSLYVTLIHLIQPLKPRARPSWYSYTLPVRIRLLILYYDRDLVPKAISNGLMAYASGDVLGVADTTIILSSFISQSVHLSCHHAIQTEWHLVPLSCNHTKKTKSRYYKPRQHRMQYAFLRVPPACNEPLAPPSRSEWQKQSRRHSSHLCFFALASLRTHRI